VTTTVGFLPAAASLRKRLQRRTCSTRRATDSDSSRWLPPVCGDPRVTSPSDPALPDPAAARSSHQQRTFADRRFMGKRSIQLLSSGNGLMAGQTDRSIYASPSILGHFQHRRSLLTR
jgi:hypothetical protein